ncbi:hypothetical protein LTR16_005338, partial [Cryomyces antarcticus]
MIIFSHTLPQSINSSDSQLQHECAERLHNRAERNIFLSNSWHVFRTLRHWPKPKLTGLSGELGKTIKSNGGEYGTKITDVTTHLVTTPADFDKGTTKVKQARDHPQLHVVGVEWLEQSIKNSTREDENDHRMIPGAGSAADRPASKKRGRDGKTKDEPQSDQNDSGELAAAKKQKATVKKEEDDEEDEGAKVLAKRFEDGQKATTAAPNVPIDEGCPLQ